MLPITSFSEEVAEQISNEAPLTDEVQEKEESSYLIKFKDIAKGDKDLVQRNKKKKKQFKYINSVVLVDLTPKEVDAYKSDTNVEFIEKDSKAEKSDEPSNLQQNKERITSNLSQIHVPEVQEQGIFGNGVKVAVLDSGIDLESIELNIIGGVSFVLSESTYDDFNGHGTGVSGVIAALKNGFGLIGAAPNIDLYSVKVLDLYHPWRYP